MLRSCRYSREIISFTRSINLIYSYESRLKPETTAPVNHAQLRAFHAVAELGGFSTAARKIGLTQPALTVQVKALEKDFQVQLFDRVNRGIKLTDAGETLHALTRRYFAIETEAEEFLKSVGAFRSGQIRIAADGPYHVIPLLARIREEMPEMDVNVSFGNSNMVLEALVNYDAHIGVSSSEEFDDRFTVLSESQHPIILIVPQTHEWASVKSLSIKSLHKAPLIMREAGSSTRTVFLKALTDAGVQPDIVLELGSREAVREAVAAGLGLGVVQEAEFGNDSRLAAVSFTRNRPVADERLICLEERAATPLMRELARITES